MWIWTVVPVLLSGLSSLASTAAGQQGGTDIALRVHVDVPNSSGTRVTLRYLEGPDSLRGKSYDVVVPANFVVRSQRVTLLAERSVGHGHVRLRVEHMGRPVMGEGTGDRVRIAVADGGVRVRAYPWWWPW